MQENEVVDHENILRILPPDILYYNKYGSYAGIVMTHPACVKTLKVENGDSFKKVKYHFPYLLLTYNSGQELSLYYSFEPITLDSMLFQPMLPNFHASDVMCWGTIKQPKLRALDLKELRSALWDCVFDGIYTNHSLNSVYQEMISQNVISKYAKKRSEDKVMGQMQKCINENITDGKINLFRKW